MATALITGASYGLGADFARLLAAEGHELILVARSLEHLKTIQAELEARYASTVYVLPQDLSDPQASGKLYDALVERGWNVEVLINNAGIGDFGLFHTSDLTRMQQMMQLNMNTLTLLTRLLLTGMLAKGRGKILNVASTAAFQPGPLMAVYFATKAYVLSLSVALANELKGSGVTVTALCPGATQTQFEKNANLEDSKLFKRLRPATSLDVAAFGIRSMNKGRTVAIHGWMNRWASSLIKYFPLTWQAAVVRIMQEKISS